MMSYLFIRTVLLQIDFIKKSNPESASYNNFVSSSILRSKRVKRSEQNSTKMVFIMCILFLVGNVPNSISPILFTASVSFYFYNCFVIFGNFMLFVSRGSFFLIYYNFNENFRLIILKFLRKNILNKMRKV